MAQATLINLMVYATSALWRKALPQSLKYKAPLVVQWSRPLLPVQMFLSDEGSNLGRGRSWSDAYSPETVLQSYIPYGSNKLCTSVQAFLVVPQTPPQKTLIRLLVQRTFIPLLVQGSRNLSTYLYSRVHQI